MNSNLRGITGLLGKTLVQDIPNTKRWWGGGGGGGSGSSSKKLFSTICNCCEDMIMEP
jgi:hypothetical protein